MSYGFGSPAHSTGWVLIATFSPDKNRTLLPQGLLVAARLDITVQACRSK
jgi:hypothetical protein